MAWIQNTDSSNYWWGYKAETLIHCLWECKMVQLFGKQFRSFSFLFYFLLYFFYYHSSPLHPPPPPAVTTLLFMSRRTFTFLLEPFIPWLPQELSGFSLSMSLFLFCLFSLFVRLYVKSYGVCLSLTGLFHLAWCSPGPSMLLQRLNLKPKCPSVDGSIEISYKMKCAMTIGPSNCAPEHLPKWVDNLCLDKTLHTGVWRSVFIIAKTWKQPRRPSAGGW